MANSIIKLLFAFVLTAFFLLSSCKKEDGKPPVINQDEGLLVVCEGNFNWGNASITNYVETSGLLRPDFFQLINDYSLGDVAQSIHETKDAYLIVVNNSGKIEVVDKTTFNSISTISGLSSPRFCESINDSTVYVSDLYSGEISIVDFKNATIMGTILLEGWSEEMGRAADSIYVSLYSQNAIAILNSHSHELEATIELDLPPTSLQVDKNENIWVVANEFEGASKLYKIDPHSRSIISEWDFEVNNQISQISIPEGGDFIYLASSNGEISKIAVAASNLIEPLFSISINGLYGLTINSSGQIYICEAFDYVQNGRVTKYNEDGDELLSFESGISPNSVIFR